MPAKEASVMRNGALSISTDTCISTWHSIWHHLPRNAPTSNEEALLSLATALGVILWVFVFVHRSQKLLLELGDACFREPVAGQSRQWVRKWKCGERVGFVVNEDGSHNDANG